MNNHIKTCFSTAVFAIPVCFTDLRANNDGDAERDVVNHAANNYFGSINSSRFAAEFKDIQNHGADNVHSSVTEAVSLAFAIFVLRDGLKDKTKLNRAYQIQIGKLVKRVGEKNCRLIVTRGYKLGEEYENTWSFGLHFFDGDPPSENALSKFLESFLDLAEQGSD